MNKSSFDFAIVGAGAAGLQLAIKFSQDDFFKEKSILILDKDEKIANDHTWSFWELGESQWDEIALQTWSKGSFINQKEEIKFSLDPYSYKSVRAEQFYEYAKQKINDAENISWIRDKIVDIKDQQIEGESGSYSANQIFDSRIPEGFNERQGNYNSLLQHFHGWFIKTSKPTFDPSSFTMMDYRMKWNNETSFMYVLPFSETYALVEFTLFNKELIEIESYESFLKKYLQDNLNITEYEIDEIEHGVIPMSDYPFHKHHSKHITKIGTAGGWVRPSSGYSFKNADRYSSMLIQNIKSGYKPEKGIGTSRYRTYDSIFLNVLCKRNDLGEEIFTRLYMKPKIQEVFRFLDESSSLREDFKVMFSLNKPQFWKAFLTTFWR